MNINTFQMCIFQEQKRRRKGGATNPCKEGPSEREVNKDQFNYFVFRYKIQRLIIQ